MTTSRSFRASLVILFCIVSTSALAREMIYRRDRHHGPGYNTGTGRFVDQDRFLSLEVDAYTPAKASLLSQGDHRVQEWGLEMQFNLGPVAVGPEFWFGEYAKAGSRAGGADLAADESYKILYNRYLLTVSRFARKEQMRGWYAKGGYSYTKIDAKTTLLGASGGTVYSNLDESRHGLALAGGHRFTYFANRASLNLGLAYTKTLDRTVSGSRSLSNRYGSILANAGDKRLAAKDFPEIRLAVGFLF